MTNRFDVIVCGSLHLDIVVNAKFLPRIDETAVGTKWKQVCGGKGGNQAVQAARAGARTAMIGRVGNDAFGKTLLSNLESENVDSSCVVVDPLKGSGMSVAISQEDGEYGAVIVSGSNLNIDDSTLSDAWTKLGGSKVLVLQNEIPHAVNVIMARTAKDSGAIVVLNAAPAREFGKDLRDLCDVLVVNKIEAESMCGLKVEDRASARAAIPKLAKTSRSVIITLGAEGMVVAPAGGKIVDVMPVPVRVTSTHGAGDCFVGTLAAMLAAGESVINACQTANQRAAAFVSRSL